ncbi:MAG: hypothetical protein JSS78_11765 [Bacteroidetes bacterium]|nr:hypothetical protein [Bacteroidota bacterium]
MRKTFIRSILTLGISFASLGVVNAQLGVPKEYIEPPGWSIGTSIGLSDLWGDVGTKSIISHYANDKYWNAPHFMGGLFARYSSSPGFAVRFGVNYGSFYANDNWNASKATSATNSADDAYQRYMRNLSVRTNIWEMSVLMELTPKRLNFESKGAKKRFQPYLLLGVAGFHFKPMAKYIDRNGNDRGYVNLYDLNVEANGVSTDLYKDAKPKYSLWQVAVPAGIGVRWDIGRRLALGVEWIYRLTFTDYLDGVSNKYVDPALYAKMYPNDPNKAALAAEMQDQSYLIDKSYSHKPGDNRGNASNKDSYSSFGLTFIFKIPSKKMPWWY